MVTKTCKNSGHIMPGEPVNVLEVTRVVCDMSVGLGAWITSSGDTKLCDVKNWVQCVTGETVRFSPTSVTDDGGAQHIRREQFSPVRLVFWVEIGLRPRYVVCSDAPGSEGSQLVGIASWSGFRCAL